MRKKRNEHKFRSFMGKFLPYVAAFLVVFGVAKIGSESKNDSKTGSINMNAMAADNYNVSADQLSELYVVASVSNSFDLASVDTVAGNYVIVQSMKEISQTTTDRIEKPVMPDTGFSRGVQTHEVKEGETMSTIAAKYGVTTDQIRWSNGLKNTNVEVGQFLKVPTTPGIVYTVKAGDSAESLAKKYRSDVEAIIAYNDLEGGVLSAGSQIVLPGGILPYVERPEYVAPVYTYTYAGSYSSRQNIRDVTNEYNILAMDGGGGGYGQCTWFAWWWRANDPRSEGVLPRVLGNANTWARGNYGRVDRIPTVGSVFQTNSGYWGHVGVVLRVNDDGSILVREANYLNPRAYISRSSRVYITEATIPASSVGSFNYIH